MASVEETAPNFTTVVHTAADVLAALDTFGAQRDALRQQGELQPDEQLVLDSMTRVLASRANALLPAPETSGDTDAPAPAPEEAARVNGYGHAGSLVVGRLVEASAVAFAPPTAAAVTAPGPVTDRLLLPPQLPEEPAPDAALPAAPPDAGVDAETAAASDPDEPGPEAAAADEDPAVLAAADELPVPPATDEADDGAEVRDPEPETAPPAPSDDLEDERTGDEPGADEPGPEAAPDESATPLADTFHDDPAADPDPLPDADPVAGAPETEEAPQPPNGRSIDRVDSELLAKLSDSRKPTYKHERATEIIIIGDKAISVNDKEQKLRVPVDGSPSVVMQVFNIVLNGEAAGKSEFTLGEIMQIINDPELDRSTIWQAIQRFLKTGAFERRVTAATETSFGLPKFLEIVDMRDEPEAAGDSGGAPAAFLAPAARP